MYWVVVSSVAKQAPAKTTYAIPPRAVAALRFTGLALPPRQWA